MRNTAVARINLAAIRENLTVVRALCPRSRIMAMVKADGYGHGLLPVAQALSAADGLGVARLQEALLLREHGVAQRLLVLGTLLDAEDLATCSRLRIDVTAHDNRSVACIAKQSQETPLRVWLKLDSGMHRMGLDPELFLDADRLLSKHPGVLELVHMTHFSHAADGGSAVTDGQLARFRDCHDQASNADVSLANSAALISRRETRADWVRPGIMLYGDNPFGPAHSLRLRAAMTLSARVIALREIGLGESVGYGGTWTSSRRSRIGTIGIGYGDGYPRHASNGTPVWINGHLASLVGQVCMDSLMIDLTDCGRVSVGDEAILWGTELPCATIARHAATISYQLLTSIQDRVTREYTDTP
jgi:alanine racemase